MEGITKMRYRGIRWIIGFLIFSVYMTAYSLVERRISGKKKWVAIVIAGFLITVVAAIAITPMTSPTYAGIFLVSWIVLLAGVTAYEWLSLPKEEKTWW